MNPPAWLYNESAHLATDFHNPEQVATYDARQQTQLNDERSLIQDLGIRQGDTLLEYGSGTGIFALAAAEAGANVHAVDISEAMLAYARTRAEGAGVDGITFHQGGFLTYQHAGQPADWIVTKYALHHLPDFWKGVALSRLRDQLKSGGRLVIQDVIFSFAPEDYRQEIDRWIDEVTREGTSFSRQDFEAHVRDEHSTFTWVLEALVERSGFLVADKQVFSPVYARYVCVKEGERNSGDVKLTQ